MAISVGETLRFYRMSRHLVWRPPCRQPNHVRASSPTNREAHEYHLDISPMKISMRQHGVSIGGGRQRDYISHHGQYRNIMSAAILKSRPSPSIGAGARLIMPIFRRIARYFSRQKSRRAAVMMSADERRRPSWLPIYAMRARDCR